MTLVLTVEMMLLLLTLLALWWGVRLHALLRAGELGRSWQFIVLGVLLLMLRELLRLGNQLIGVPFAAFWERIAEAGFMVMLCYALWRQWNAFTFMHGRRKKVNWQRIAQSFEAAPEEQKTPTQEGHEQWYRKA
ncbi:MAG: hypothetical protein IMHGJWDQ_000340 [Candidatus Fervidibacter sp.]